MITIQLRTKMKILTKHVVKLYFYNVIFWNMKYLFFFNCQLLLLCCVCCKFAIQDFVQEDRQKYMEKLHKYWQFHRRVHRWISTLGILPRIGKKITDLCRNYRRVHRWIGTRRYFTESWKKNYVLVPQLLTGTPTDWYPSVFYWELEKNYRLVPPLPTGTPTNWYP
jgi:hypothetical protein